MTSSSEKADASQGESNCLEVLVCGHSLGSLPISLLLVCVAVVAVACLCPFIGSVLSVLSELGWCNSGGAMATLCAAELAIKWRCRHQVRVRLYTFGSPRVGNVAFAKLCAEFLPDTWRLVNHCDPVPTVPSYLGTPSFGERFLFCGDNRYSHVQNLVLLREGGQVILAPLVLGENIPACRPSPSCLYFCVSRCIFAEFFFFLREENAVLRPCQSLHG